MKHTEKKKGALEKRLKTAKSKSKVSSVKKKEIPDSRTKKKLPQKTDYKSLVEKNYDIIFSLDKKGKITFVSASWEKIVGSKPTEITGKHLADLVLPEHKKSIEEFLTEVSEKGGLAEGTEFVIEKKPGKEIWLRATVNPLFDSKNKIAGFNGIARDVTSHKTSRFELNKNVALFKDLAENMFDIVVLTDMSGKMVYCSESVSQVGYSVSDVTGKNVFEFIHPDDVEIAKTSFEKLLNGSQTQRNNYRFLTKNGKYLYYEIIAKFHSGDSDYPEGRCLFSGRNVHDIIVAEEKNRINEQKQKDLTALFQLMADTMPDLLWAKNMKKEYLFTNKAICEKLLNASNTSEPLGKTDIYFAERERKSHPEIKDWHTFGEICVDSDAITLNENREMQFDEYGNVKGKFLFLDVHKAPLRNEKGELIGVVGSGRDMTGQKQSEELLIQTKETYLGLFNTLTEAIYILDDEGTFIDVNRGAEIMYGYTRDELIGKNPILVAAEGLNELGNIFEMMGETKASGKTARFEFWAKRKNGEIFPKDVIVNKGKYFGKEVLIATARDITQQKKAEKEIINLNERMMLAAEAGRLGVWEYNLISGLLVWDDGMLRIYGITREEFEGNYNSYQKFVHPDDLEKTIREEKETLANKDEFQSEFRIIRKSSETRHVRSAAKVTRDKNGKPFKVIGINLDITDRKKASERISNLAHCMLNFGNDKNSNINQLVKLCGESLSSACALYNKLDDGMLCSVGIWNTPENFNPIDNPQGHICYDVITQAGEEPLIIHNLEKTNYYFSDPNVSAFNLKTYIGVPVVVEGRKAGSLCAVYVDDYHPTKDEIDFFKLIAYAVANEEERKNNEEKLAKSEINLRAIIENSLESIWSINTKYEIEYVNEVFAGAFFASFGVKLEKGINLIDSLPPGLRELWKERYARAFSNEHFLFIDKVETLMGDAYIEVAMYPIVVKGIVTGASFYGKNITEKTLSEIQLKYESNFRKLLAELANNFINLPTEAINQGIQNSLSLLGEFVDSDRVYIFEYNLNKQTASNTFKWCRDGIAPCIQDMQNVSLKGFDFWIDKHIKGEILSYDSVEDIQNMELKAIFTQQNIQSLLTIPLMKEKVCVGFIGLDSCKRKHRFTNSEKELLQVFAQMLVNIMERIETENELVVAKDKAELNSANITAIIENTTDNIWAIDNNYFITYLNNNFKKDYLKTFGIELKVGSSFKLALPAPANQIWKERYERAFKNEQFTIEDVFETPNGLKYVEVSFNPIFIEGKVIGISCYGRDITQSKLTEKQIIDAKNRAEESDRLKSAFLANMSHEIRTPMNGILGFANLLQEPGLSGEQQTKYLQIIEKSGRRMLNIINDIIDISKLESGLMKLEYTDSNVNEQVEYIYNFFKTEAAGKGIILKSQLPLNNYEAGIRTDREKLFAVLTNLVKNAIKYSHSGEIQLGYQPKGNYLEFYVKDNGIGIPKERHEAIFERFIQADIEDRQAYQGAGLGLAISKAYIEMLGGKIWVESEPGAGSQFYFTLPWENKTGKSPVEENEARIKEPKLSKKLKILIAEDDKTSEILLTIMIGTIADSILVANSGSEALELLKANPDIDLILMDIQLPGMNGYEVTKTIRKTNKDVVIIAQTAYGLAGDREKAIEAGCNNYISKPIHFNSLVRMVSSYFKEME